MKLPNFLIVGAAKCGTTSLYEYLKAHPQVFMPKVKEPAHFVEGIGKYGGIESWEEYCRLFEYADDFQRVGEASGRYLLAPEAPCRIKSALGNDIDIIILLRDPVQVAYSFWGHMVRIGIEPLGFSEALRCEQERIDRTDILPPGYWPDSLTYLHHARYGQRVARYLESFPRERVHIYLFEEFFKSGLPLYPELLSKLGLAPNHRPAPVSHNPAGYTRSLWLRRALSQKSTWKDALKATLPQRTRERLIIAAERLNRVNRPLPPLSRDAVSTVRAAVSADVEFASAVVGRNLKPIWGFE